VIDGQTDIGYYLWAERLADGSLTVDLCEVATWFLGESRVSLAFVQLLMR
jgi:hypothetical protein